jgi:hypothetical protein
VADPDFSVDLGEQLSDQRSNEVAYKLSLQNRGDQRLHLLSITPFLPESVKLSETKSPSFAAVSARRDALTKELDSLLQTVMSVDQSALLAKRAEVWKELYQELGSSTGIFRIYFRVFSGRLAKQMNERVRQEGAFKFTIESYEDGEKAQLAFVEKSSLEGSLKELYSLKLMKLKGLDERIGAGVEAATLATIQPKSTFSTTYVLSFKRRPLSSRRYNISFEVAVAEEGKPERQVAVASASLLISPQGYILNLIVILSAVMGVILKTAVDPKLQAAAMKVMVDPAALGWPLVHSMVVALVFFNVYEFTNLADRVKMALSWRSALLVGVLCGLMSDRVIAALQAFLK